MGPTISQQKIRFTVIKYERNKDMGRIKKFQQILQKLWYMSTVTRLRQDLLMKDEKQVDLLSRDLSQKYILPTKVNVIKL